MAHEISVNSNGQHEAFFAMKPAWHGLGTVLDHPANSQEAMEQSHLADWTVETEPLKTDSGIEVSGWYATVRSDMRDKPEGILGVVTGRYRVVQNRDAFTFLDSLMLDGAMQYESAGALRGGKTIWLLARLPSVDYITENDASRRYILFSSSHDGTGAIHAMPTAVRVVCANTLRLATIGQTGIRHTGDVAGKLEKAREFLSQLDEKFTSYTDKARLMTTKQFTRLQGEQYMELLFPSIEEAGRAQTIREHKLQKIRQNFRRQTNALPGMKNTYWSAYNAVSEFIDHQSSTKGNDQRRRENRFQSSIDGAGAALKTKAFDLAYSMACAV